MRKRREEVGAAGAWLTRLYTQTGAGPNVPDGDAAEYGGRGVAEHGPNKAWAGKRRKRPVTAGESGYAESGRADVKAEGSQNFPYLRVFYLYLTLTYTLRLLKGLTLRRPLPYVYLRVLPYIAFTYTLRMACFLPRLMSYAYVWLPLSKCLPGCLSYLSLFSIDHPRLIVSCCLSDGFSYPQSFSCL